MIKHKNEQGIAIVIVIAIMVALIMIVTALLGTVTRMGDTAKAIKFSNTLKLATLSIKANAIFNLNNALSIYDNAKTDDILKIFRSEGEPNDFTSLGVYFDKDFKPCETGTIDIYELKYKRYTIDLSSCFYTEIIRKDFSIGPKISDLFSSENFTEANKWAADANVIPTYFFKGKAGTDNVSTANLYTSSLSKLVGLSQQYYSFTDIGSLIAPFVNANKYYIMDNSLVYNIFSPYVTATDENMNELKVNVAQAPKWLIANMLSRYKDNQYESYDFTNDEKKTIFDKIYENRNLETENEIASKLFETSIYKNPITAEETEQGKRNAALEKLIYSLFQKNNNFHYIKKEEECSSYSEPTFTGLLVVKDSCKLKQLYRILIKTVLVNTAKDEIIGSKSYECVYDKTNSRVIYSRWFEYE